MYHQIKSGIVVINGLIKHELCSALKKKVSKMFGILILESQFLNIDVWVDNQN